MGCSMEHASHRCLASLMAPARDQTPLSAGSRTTTTRKPSLCFAVQRLRGKGTARRLRKPLAQYLQQLSASLQIVHLASEFGGGGRLEHPDLVVWEHALKLTQRGTPRGDLLEGV